VSRTLARSIPRYTRWARPTYRFRWPSCVPACRPNQLSWPKPTATPSDFHYYRSVGLLDAGGAAAALSRPIMGWGPQLGTASHTFLSTSCGKYAPGQPAAHPTWTVSSLAGGGRGL
jgi:hypothetical protein